jgi:hypothetical protein
MSTICMKIDPGMHIGLHLVFFGKTGVTLLRQHVTEASTYITVHYRNDIHALSRCMDSVQPRTPSI